MSEFLASPMSTESPEPESRPVAGSPPKSPRPSWETWSAAVAVVIGLLSLAVSAYTAYTLRVQTRAQVYPYLEILDMGSEQRYVAFNKGVGPAFVRSMRVEVDGKPQKTWRGVLKALGVPVAHKLAYSNLNHVPLAANEKLPILIFDDVAEFRAFEDVDAKRYTIDVCYCSVLDECWAMRWSPALLPEPKPADACRADPATDFEQ